MKRGWWVALVLLLSLPRLAAAREDRVEPLVLIIGVNQSIDTDVPRLRFADDDAARYYDLFASMGTEPVLLTRMDENTRRLHPSAAAHARPPRLARLDQATLALAARAAAARRSRLEPILYVIYAGHGNVKDGAGYVALEDARLTGKQIEARIVDRVRPVRTHVIADACQSFFLAHARGPGGARRKVEGFSGLGGIGARTDVGVLLSTSSARDSHEWERVQAGVFSHEVRSGLFGAADADRDGRVTYREIAAFVERANTAIPNERFRPDVYARPPAGDEALLDLRQGLRRRIELDGAVAAHYLVEDEYGVVLAEFHNAPHESVHLVRPPGERKLYVARMADGREFEIEPQPDVARTSALALNEPRHQARGAAHVAFSRTFELPFGRRTVEGYRFRPEAGAPGYADASAAPSRWRDRVGMGLTGVGVASSALGAWSLYSAHREASQAVTIAQAEVPAENRRIRSGNIAAGVAFGVGGAALASGLTLLLWPDAPAQIGFGASSGGVGAEVRGSF